MASVKIVLKKDKVKANGEAPLYLRIIKNRKANFISLGYSVNPKLWDEKNNKIKRSHPNSVRLNSYIIHKLTEASDIVLQNETSNSYIQVAKLKNQILGKNGADFIDYFRLYITRLEKEGKVASYKKANSILDKIVKYIKKKSLGFAEINVSWLKKYEHYLKAELGNSQNTVHSNLKLIRKLFNDAISEDIIPNELYPFTKYKLEWEKNNKNDFLLEEDIIKIRELPLDRKEKIDVHRNMFVFSCYSGGLRISDLLQIKWSMYDGKCLNFTSYKTGENHSIKVPTIGREILAIYHQGDFKSKYDQYIFPILENLPFESDKEKHNTLSRVTSLMNKNLKIIAKKAGLNQTKISTHWARRSWICMALAKGMNLDVASKILGHKGETVTLESYARYNNTDLHRAMDIFD